MSTPRKHDYALLRKILAERPELEQNVPALAREYAHRHPSGEPIPQSSIRTILRQHSSEVLGRPWRPGAPHTPVLHDYDLIRKIIEDEPALLHQPAEVARRYSEKTTVYMSRVYMGQLLREWRGRLAGTVTDVATSDCHVPPSLNVGADRFAEILRLYAEHYPREHDVLHNGTWYAYYADLLADSIHWARLNGIQVETAMTSAWESVLRETS